MVKGRNCGPGREERSGQVEEKTAQEEEERGLVGQKMF